MSTDKNILIDIWLISLLADRMVAEILHDIPLSVDEFAAYGLISDLAPITSADLVRATGLSPTTVSTLVRRCEARGELVRTENPDDARSALLELTPEGYRLLGLAVPRLMEAIDRIRGNLTGRHDQVRESLRDLDSAFRSDLRLGPRPYHLSLSEVDSASLDYHGERLSAGQVEEVRRYIDWVRERDR
jgi:DNA-binding MarR family transcriptional regulator